ncbi:pseudouridine synthase [Alkalitalea saponilacus]|uniref:Pseudouridine synthase n=1 Tax=Alkalitalea saponilacus TaxID=889453 RepID=A0A1T5HSW4_9BACT|nr:pseudouridine synthase [Alkalitalea saponilacus]ASB48368.1 pseudouridine synthase [Alkalitalea saponilacus]SKC23600.1 pseudouridine synthase [Alkalitalea saponilacus]
MRNQKRTFNKQNQDKKRPDKSFSKREQRPNRTQKPKYEEPEQSDVIRLNRYIANSGVCSRREADELISKGLITVNGNVVKELGLKVSKNDVVKYDGKKLNPEHRVYILINKPKDMVTTSSDPEGRRTVLDLVEEACDERVYPVGRLDKNTTGVLLLTNDGDLSKKLTHPSSEIKKIYHVFTDKPVTKAHIDTISKGIELEDGLIKVDAVSYAHEEDKKQVGIEIHSGRNRIVRRIFEHLGYQVEKLDRVWFAGLTKRNLPRGKWRFLTPDEVKYLKAGMF